MKNKFFLILLIVLFVISTCLSGLGFYYGIKNDNEEVNTDENNKQKEILECSFDGELVQGAEYINGQYTYRYMQDSHYMYGDVYEWQDIQEDGWGVTLTDKESSNPVTTKLCTTINGKPIVSMNEMFYEVEAESIDLSSFDTSNVTNMSSMFSNSSVTKLDLSSFNTSSVTDMSEMFSNSSVTKLDLSSFNTLNVTNMNGMFNGSNVTKLDLSSFDTSNVKYMAWMFSDSEVSEIKFSDKFNTSKVTNMSEMFSNSSVTKLDLSSFNTSSVTDMSRMFVGIETDELNLSNFDMKSVKNMSYMFNDATIKTLNLSNADTRNVEDMSGMFLEADIESMIGFEKLNTSKVTNMEAMFAYFDTKLIDVSNFDTSNVEAMNGMFANSIATEIKGLEKFNTSKVEDMRAMFKNTSVDVLNLSSFDLSNIKNVYCSEEATDESKSYDEYRDSCNYNYGDNMVLWSDNVFGTYGMFEGAKATVGYARNKTEADKLNQSGNKPSNLNFVVK